jgi:antitoxin StbD
MTATVTASDARKNFDHWHDRSRTEPVRITEHGRESAYLVSAETFHALWSCYRKAIGVGALSDAEMALIMEAEVSNEHAYEMPHLDETSDASTPKHGT